MALILQWVNCFIGLIDPKTRTNYHVCLSFYRATFWVKQHACESTATTPSVCKATGPQEQLLLVRTTPAPRHDWLQLGALLAAKLGLAAGPERPPSGQLSLGKNDHLVAEHGTRSWRGFSHDQVCSQKICFFSPSLQLKPVWDLWERACYAGGWRALCIKILINPNQNNQG